MSFDDGPTEYTDEILDLFKSYNAHATFFLGGILNGRGAIDDPKHAGTVMRMYNEGHQIGSHTWSHPNLDKLTNEERKREMFKTERAIAVRRTLKNKTGVMDNDSFVWKQVWMALKDPQTWCLVLYTFCVNLCNGGITTVCSPKGSDLCFLC